MGKNHLSPAYFSSIISNYLAPPCLLLSANTNSLQFPGNSTSPHTSAPLYVLISLSEQSYSPLCHVLQENSSSFFKSLLHTQNIFFYVLLLNTVHMSVAHITLQDLFTCSNAPIGL